MPFARVPERCHPGRRDGEALRPGWVAQPVCATSSIALAAGSVVLARTPPGSRGARSADGARTWAGRMLAVALGANAIGSAGFHGPGDRASRALHDVSLWAIVAVCGAGAVDGLLHAPAATARALAVPAALVAGGAAIGGFGRTGGPLCRPRSPLQPHAAWHALAAAGVTLAGRRLFGPDRPPGTLIR